MPWPTWSPPSTIWAIFFVRKTPPGATIALTRIGQAKALLSGRDYVVPEDLKAFAHEVLRHRIMLTFEALADGVVSDQIVDKIVETVPVP